MDHCCHGVETCSGYQKSSATTTRLHRSVPRKPCNTLHETASRRTAFSGSFELGHIDLENVSRLGTSVAVQSPFLSLLTMCWILCNCSYHRTPFYAFFPFFRFWSAPSFRLWFWASPACVSTDLPCLDQHIYGFQLPACTAWRMDYLVRYLEMESMMSFLFVNRDGQLSRDERCNQSTI